MDLLSGDSQNVTAMDIDTFEEKSLEDERTPSSSQSLESSDQFPGYIGQFLDVKPSPSVLSETTGTLSSNGLQENVNSNTASSSSASTSFDGFQNTDIQSNGESAPEIDYNSEGEFCFESDHIALKENSDYRKLMHIIIVLEAKRAKAIKDLQKLIDMRDIAMADPIKFVERLQRKEDLRLPGPQDLPSLPDVDWSKYTVSDFFPGGRRQNTRLAAKASLDIKPNVTEFFVKGKGSSASVSRKCPEESKPATFNLSWTAEEQKRLEELLTQYPPEEIESRRWEKIAFALGNRTPIQVASRVQKYFIKLTRAGIPVPGRAPNISHFRKPRRQVIRQQPSTFLVSQTPTVYMLEDDDDFGICYDYSMPGSIDENSSDARLDGSDDDEISPELRETAEYREYSTLKKIVKDNATASGLAQHVGYKCNRCGCEPIIGIRWHCTECEPQNSIDFCEDCVDCMHESGNHTANHHLQAVHQACTTFMDRDYMHFLGSDYNYLDPNYMPST